MRNQGVGRAPLSREALGDEDGQEIDVLNPESKADFMSQTPPENLGPLDVH